LPAIVGLLAVGIFADGTVGQGWQMTGIDSYLGVSGQGVSGLFTGSGFQMDFPGQLQAQVIGILSLALWGFSTGMLFCAPLGLLLHSLLRPAGGIGVTRAPVLIPADGDGDAFAPEPPSVLPTPAPSSSPPPRRTPSKRQAT
jgi:hypothetical protein